MGARAYQSAALGQLLEEDPGDLLLDDVADVYHVVRRVLLQPLLGLPCEEYHLTVIKDLEVALLSVLD